MNSPLSKALGVTTASSLEAIKSRDVLSISNEGCALFCGRQWQCCS
jgi:hypothetical protein